MKRPRDLAAYVSNAIALAATRVGIVAAGIAAAGSIDYVTGVQIRVFPLYFAPIAYAAWHFGEAGTLLASLASTAMWVYSNVLAGMVYEHQAVWLINAAMQSVAFGLFGWLICVLRERERREHARAFTDPLTQQLNRRAFSDLGARLLERCRGDGKPVTIAFVDIDDFKRVNDIAGHAAGDIVLTEVATIIREGVRPTDLVGRYGGDEFVVLLPDVRASDATLVLERLRATIADRFAGRRVPVTATIGAATFEMLPGTMDEMVRISDAAMYAGKRGGKNRVTIEMIVAAASKRQ